MLTRTVAVIAAMVVAVLTLSIVIGLTAPDGAIRDADAATTRPTPTREAPATASPTPPAEPDATGTLAPASVTGVWPGRPAETTLDGTDVDWCPAIRTDASAEATAVFGKKRVAAAACAAVSFVFDHRYSRLSLPRKAYQRSDFAPVLASLTVATAHAYYRPRIAEFVASPSPAGADLLGLVMLRSAGPGHRFYGPAGTDRGYADRAVWINPRWSVVVVGVDRTKATPRLSARLTASAAVPVFNRTEERDDMLTVPTIATFLMRPAGRSSWEIGGWTIDSGSSSTGRLAVNAEGSAASP